MKNLFILVIIFLLIGCNVMGVKGSGNVKSEERNISEFSKIQISGFFKVNVKIEKTTFLQITADDNFLPLIETTVKGNTLLIDTKKNLDAENPIYIEINTPHLIELNCSGANKINISDLNEEKFSLSVSGACKIYLSGSVDKFKAEMSGATKLNSEHLLAKKVYLEVSGASKVNVYASELLNAECSGASKIVYSGNPEKVDTEVSGVSSVERKNTL